MRTVELRRVSSKGARPGLGVDISDDVSFRSATRTFIPSALAKVCIRFPTAPYPIIPTVSSQHVNGGFPTLPLNDPFIFHSLSLPKSSSPGTSTSLVATLNSTNRLLVAKYSPSACSLTLSTFVPGQLHTVIPRAAAAALSTQSVPVAMITINWRCGVTAGSRREAERRIVVVMIMLAEWMRAGRLVSSDQLWMVRVWGIEKGGIGQWIASMATMWWGFMVMVGLMV